MSIESQILVIDPQLAERRSLHASLSMINADNIYVKCGVSSSFEWIAQDQTNLLNRSFIT